MAQFDDFPAEIVCGVISQISYHTSTHSGKASREGMAQIMAANKKRCSTLVDLCLTSKKMRTLTEPYLYQYFGTNQVTDKEWSDAQQQSLQGFLLTIILRPELANHIKCIEACNWRIRRPPGHANLLVGPNEELFNQVAEEFDMLKYGDWSAHLKAGSTDPLIALLLMLAPNLQSISFIVPEGSSWPRDIIGRTISGPLPANSHNFAHLQHITYAGSTDKPFFNFHEVLPFFRLPSMQRVFTIGCRDPHGPGGLEKGRKRIYYPLMRAGESSITDIRLQSSEFKPRIIEGMVRSCRALESFSVSYDLSYEYTLHGDSHSHDHTKRSHALAVLDPPELGKALSSAKQSLRILKVYVEDFICYQGFRGLHGAPQIKSIGSLQGFERLSMLEIGVVMLLGNAARAAPMLVDILPSSLEMLHLRDDNNIVYCDWDMEGILIHLVALAVDGLARFPRLRSVDLSKLGVCGCQQCQVDQEDERARLEMAFKGTGIGLVGWW